MAIITVTGDIGSGKSTVCKELSKSLNAELFYTGNILREIAESRNITIEELHQEKDIENLDHYIDTMVQHKGIQYMKEKINAVFDSRLAWHFIPCSFKVYLKVDLETSIERLTNLDRKAEFFKDPEGLMGSILLRRMHEMGRFKKIYGIDFSEPSNYDLVIDTSKMTVKEVVNTILNHIPLVIVA